MATESIRYYLSGTDGKTGGAKGAVRVLSQSGTGITTITGVTINDAAGNTVGDGTLYYYSATKSLAWAAPSGALGAQVDVSANGTYVIQSASNGGLLVATVVAANLPSSNVNNTITIANVANSLFDDWTADETYAGTTQYRCVYVCNISSTAIKALVLWIAQNTPGLDNLAVGLDPAGAGGTAVTTANETTAPAGVTFSAVDTEATALSLGNLAAGQDYPIWIRRIAPALCDVATTPNTYRFSVSFYGQ